jgi:xanthine dehydrogenase molybdopterin binding subunit/xanthine dehydrogenase small subunit
MTGQLTFVLNGRTMDASGVSPNTTLLEFLRQRGLTGSKEGCAEGDCGACSVVIVDHNADGKPVYRAVNSCIMPVCLVAGREVVSVEGIGCPQKGRTDSSAGSLHPVQHEMALGYGSQCGYCTPGFICSLFEGYYRDDLHTHAALDEQLAGNLCRCTGYRPIRDAAVAAFAARTPDAFSHRLAINEENIGAAVYENNGEIFLRPVSLEALFDAMTQHPQARLVAGATELGLDITKRFKTFPVLISTEAVGELKELTSAPDGWRIGAAVTLTDIQDKLGAEFPMLADMLSVFGSRQIRNRATMGGNIVTASPIGDSAPCLLALDASVVLACKQTARTLAAADFFVSYRKTELQRGEILKTILIPRAVQPPGLTRKTAWYKVSKRREMDISTVAAAFVLDLDSGNVVRHARLAYGGVAALPARAKRTEAALLGKKWNAQTLQDVLAVLATEFTPISDARGTADYRIGLITSLLEKFFQETSSTGCGVTDPPLIDRRSGLKTAPPAVPHESAHKHVTGEAMYVDDQTRGMLEVWPVCSPHAHARILKRDATAARAMPGIRAVLLAEDVPGRNDVGAVKQDEILLANSLVQYHGQLIALVVGDSPEACRAAAEKVIIEYEPLPPVLTLRDAIAKGSFHNEPNFIRRGVVDSHLHSAPNAFEGEFEFGGQDHFYLETQAAHATPGEDGSMTVCSSTQHPTEIQQVVAHVLHLPANKVVVQSPRMGGGFGGKETQAATPAALAALAAHHTGLPVRVRFNRDQDMMLTGHRHPFLAKFRVGFDDSGLIHAARVHLWSNGGWAQDLSQAVTDRALFHLDNAYYLPAVEFRGQVAKTNLSSNTAFRGFGGPQGMLIIEEILDRVARRLGLTPETVRERNLYGGTGETNTTHYGQRIEDDRIQILWHELKQTAALEKRRAEIADWNQSRPHRKRGIAITPVKFGISFTVTHLNQAGALVLIYQDGSVQVNHGGTEMGQGLHTNMAMIAAQTLGVRLHNVRVMTTSTDKVPNTSATAASAGTDLNGGAVKNACEKLHARLAAVAAEMLGDTGELIFADDTVFLRAKPDVKIPFQRVVQQVYLNRVSLSANGFYATPGIHWDRVAGRGKPFHYFACGAAVTEVEVDGFTGMHRLLRVDILHDVGDPVNAGINRGQIEGGFIQGAGWLTTEELLWNDKGVLLTHSPDTYKIPSIGDAPRVFNVAMLKNATQSGVVHGSKAVGEPPLMLAISVREAIRDAVAAFGNERGEVSLPSPATSEAIWRAIQMVQAR